MTYCCQEVSVPWAEPTAEEVVEAQRLIDEGWYQTSSKFRHLARLPPNRHPQFVVFKDLGVVCFHENSAADYLCRMGPPHVEQIVASRGVFAAYKKLGGGTALSTYVPRHNTRIIIAEVVEEPPAKVT
jgi:hypothetical protein